MTLGQRLRQSRKARSLTQDEVALRLSRTRGAISQWETDTSAPDTATLRKVADLYEVDFAWLAGAAPVGMPDKVRVERALPAQRMVPVISYVQAGEWTEIRDGFDGDSAQEFIVTERRVSENAFALTVEGLSMMPEFKPGDRVIVDPEVTPTPGATVVAQLDGDERATLKRYRDRGRDQDGRQIIELAALNPDFSTLYIDSTHPGRIVGVVVEHRSYPAGSLPL